MNALSPQQDNNSINNHNQQTILRNSAILAGGGGGNYHTANQILQNQLNNEIPVKDIEEFDPRANLATFFGLGPVQDDNSVDLETVRNSVNSFEERYGEISGIVLGEIGPEVIASCCLAAQELEVPLVNADVAGMRAVPTVQTEIIENNSEISRLPAVASNQEGETVFIENERLESALRGLQNTTWFVTGYLNTAENYEQVPKGWFENCQNLPQENFETIATGEIQRWRSTEHNGHTIGYIEIENQQNRFDIYFVNENALLLRNGEVEASIPDSITLQNSQGVPIYNGCPPRTGETVEITVYNQNRYWDENSDLLTPESVGISMVDGQIYYQETPIYEILR